MMRFILLFVLTVMVPVTSAYATQVQEVVSSSGIKAWLVEEHAQPLIAVKIAFTGAGSAYDPNTLSGRSNMASAMLMEGAGNLDSHAFNEALEKTATEMNVGIDDDTLRASLVSLSEYKQQSFAYMAMAITSPRFDDEALKRVRSQNLSVLNAQEHEPAYLLQRQWQQLLFNNHPYSKPSLGTKEGVNAITKSDLDAYVKRYLTRENMVVGVVGDITAAELAKLLDEQFAQLPAHYNPDVTVDEVQIPAAAKQMVVDSDIPQTVVMFGEAGVKRSDPQYFAAYVMNHIIGGANLSSLLINEIREKRGLAYYASSRLEPMEHTGVWLGKFATRNEKVGEALQVLRSTLKNIADNGPTDQQLKDAKSYITGSFVLGLDSNAEIADYLISMQIYHLGRDYFDKRNAMVEAVTRQQVAAMAKKLADPEHLLVVMVGKPNLEQGK